MLGTNICYLHATLTCMVDMHRFEIRGCRTQDIKAYREADLPSPAVDALTSLIAGGGTTGI